MRENDSICLVPIRVTKRKAAEISRGDSQDSNKDLNSIENKDKLKKIKFCCFLVSLVFYLFFVIDCFKVNWWSWGLFCLLYDGQEVEFTSSQWSSKTDDLVWVITKCPDCNFQLKRLHNENTVEFSACLEFYSDHVKIQIELSEIQQRKEKEIRNIKIHQEYNHTIFESWCEKRKNFYTS